MIDTQISSYIDTFSTGKPARLEYVLLNESLKDRPLIVFLHEGLGSVAMWRDFPQVVCDRLQCRGLVYSRYGYGKSTQRTKFEVWNVEYLHVQARDVLPEVLRKLGFENERPILLGHSDGASIALIFASLFPDKLSSAIVMAPHIFVEDVTIDGVKLMREVYQSTDMKQKLTRYHDDPDSPFWAWNDSWLQPEFLDWNIQNLLSSIKCPLLCIQGHDDEYATMAQLDGIKELVPHAVLSKISKCGHSPQKDQLDAVLAMTEKHLSNLI